MRAILCGIAALAVTLPAIIVRNAPPPPASPRAALAGKVRLPQRIAAPDRIPDVEPVAFQSLDPAEARAWNAGVPFVSGATPAARPFRFAGDAAQLARATDCLGAALIYEAGDDPVGQRAVAQVVLNRVRHPAFPKTVCGVVFQGAERRTGCQFTFTCDGAMTRPPSLPAWERARRIAAQALNGAVAREVGYATHYHTDWVVPYWSASLDKIAEVHTHLFFRWTGWWGTPGAFRRRVSPDEPVISELAALSPAHRIGAVVAEAEAAVAEGAALTPTVDPAVGAMLAGLPHALTDDRDTFMVTIDPLAPNTFPRLALRACAARPRCKLMGWSDPRLVPTSSTLSPQQYAAMGFSYLRDQESGIERALWNCHQFPRLRAAQCMRGRATLSATPAPAPSPTTRGPEGLSGVRKAPAPVATPAGTITQP
ncbi:cell wall hydrolase [Sphingomonas sp.]|uniref:cell wall hydrolase n=1 Tax=Sphingomonas sp. TaxID=28214 RepID=UPI0035C7B742